jgi:Fe-S-cluster containining protein
MLTPALEKQRQRLFAQTVTGMTSKLATVACRAGCGHCCSVPVEVQAHEVFFAAEYIQTHFTPAELIAAIERTSLHRTRTLNRSHEERTRLQQPCALLRDDHCSIYAGRPEACRAHHTNNAAACAAHAADPTTPIEKHYIPALRARLFAVMLGVDEALEAAGWDHRAYDFGSALHEALTNSLCLVRWLQHRPAFPDSCLAP